MWRGEKGHVRGLVWRGEEGHVRGLVWRGEEGHVLSVRVAQLDLTHAMASLAALIKYLEVCQCA